MMMMMRHRISLSCTAQAAAVGSAARIADHQSRDEEASGLACRDNRQQRLPHLAAGLLLLAVPAMLMLMLMLLLLLMLMLLLLLLPPPLLLVLLLLPLLLLPPLLRLTCDARATPQGVRRPPAPAGDARRQCSADRQVEQLWWRRRRANEVRRRRHAVVGCRC
jgi:hypothetical protein